MDREGLFQNNISYCICRLPTTIAHLFPFAVRVDLQNDDQACLGSCLTVKL